MAGETAIVVQPDDRVDLHMHTIWSDGHWVPESLFDHLAQEHFRLVAVTDHDRVDRLDLMCELGAARGIAVLPGVELTTRWRDQIVHLLCYGFDAARGALETVARRTFDAQLANTNEVNAELVRRGYSFPHRDKVLKDNAGVLVRPLDNARLLLEHGYVADIAAGIALMAEAGYSSATAPLAEAIAAVHADGGIAIIAHPGRSAGDFSQVTLANLDDIRAEGIPLDGIEVYYPIHSDEQIESYARYVAAHGWLASSGSDSHGPRQRFPIPYPAEQAAALLERCGVIIQS